MSYCNAIKNMEPEERKALHKNYHDNYYGFPIEDDNELFGRLLMEINQAGLSWETILKKEATFRKAYQHFNIKKVAAYKEADRERLMKDAGIIRNRLKINAAIENAKTILVLQKEFGSFKKWIELHHPKTKEEWVKLFKNTFKFTGGEIVNKFLMSAGYLPGSHSEDCPVYKKIIKAKPMWMRKTMRSLIIIFSFLLITTAAAAQQTVQQRIDSMLALMPVVKDDTNRTKLIYRISEAYDKIDPKESMRYILMGMEDARKKKFDKGVASFHASIASILMDNALIDSALLHLDTALRLNKKIDNNRGIASTFINIGAAYQRDGNDVEAIRYTLQAIPYLEIVKDTNYLSLTYRNLANSYHAQENYKDATIYVKKSQALSILIGDTGGEAKALYQLGSLSFDQKDTVQAIKHFSESLKLYNEIENLFGIAETYQGLAAAEPDFIKSLGYNLKSQAIYNEIAPEHISSIMNLTNMGVAHLDLVRHDKLKDLKPGKFVPASKQQALQIANNYLTKTVLINRKIENPDGLWFSLAHLSTVQELQGDYKAALDNQRESTRIHDSLFSQENKNEIAALTGERELALRDKQLELNKISISAQKKQRIALIAGLLLVTAIGGLLYWQNRTRKKTNSTLLILNNELDEANKIKARFFGIISHDLRSPIASLIAFLNLQKEAPDVFTAEQAAAQQAKITTAAESILETMESMLQWSKSQMEHFKPQIKTIPVERLFNHIKNNFPENSNLQFQFANAQKLNVNTDEDYLKTIMHNLTANAVKALHQNTNGFIEWKAVEENGKTVLSITDNGPGAAAQQMDALYNKDAAVNSKNGLGLHLIRDLAKAIECAISFSSAPNEGTTFQLRLA